MRRLTRERRDDHRQGNIRDRRYGLIESYEGGVDHSRVTMAIIHTGSGAVARTGARSLMATCPGPGMRVAAAIISTGRALPKHFAAWPVVGFTACAFQVWEAAAENQRHHCPEYGDSERGDQLWAMQDTKHCESLASGFVDFVDYSRAPRVV